MGYLSDRWTTLIDFASPQFDVERLCKVREFNLVLSRSLMSCTTSQKRCIAKLLGCRLVAECLGVGIKHSLSFAGVALVLLGQQSALSSLMLRSIPLVLHRTVSTTALNDYTDKGFVDQLLVVCGQDIEDVILLEVLLGHTLLGVSVIQVRL